MSLKAAIRATLCVAWAVIGATFGPQAVAQPAPSAALDAIAAKAATGQPVRVIVGLNIAHRPDAELTQTQALAQRGGIAAAQTALLEQLAGANAKAHARYETIPFIALEVDSDALAKLRASSLVSSIEDDRVLKRGLAQSAPMIRADSAWSRSILGTGWTVAILDTGVDKNHPFLATKVVSEACYSSNTVDSISVCPGFASSSTAVGSGVNCTVAPGCEHGTHVAGIAAGGTNLNDGSHGVAPAAKVIAVQVFSYFPFEGDVFAFNSDILKGLERVYALRATFKIAAVNMSLGGGGETGFCDAAAPSVKTAIDNLRTVGIATVISSGNSGFRNAIGFPACISSAISVGATCDAGSLGWPCALGTGQVAEYSNISPFVSVLAPGSFITSSIPGGGYDTWNGTSMAAPHVTGAFALMKQKTPTQTVSAGLQLLRDFGRDVSDLRSGGFVTGLKQIDLIFLGGNELKVTKTGNGTGWVVSQEAPGVPSRIYCPSDCSHIYPANEVVVLEAWEASNSKFIAWGGACTGVVGPVCAVTMNAAKTVTATFNTSRLTVTKTGTGTGNVISVPPGINCPGDCAENYVPGTVVQLWATPVSSSPATTYTWGGACLGTPANTSPCVISMATSKSASIAFTGPTAKRLTVLTSGPAGAKGSGGVVSADKKIFCPTDCTEDYYSNENVELEATPNVGSSFDGWTGACLAAGKNPFCTVSMSLARSVTANFRATHFNLTVLKTGSGTVSSYPGGISCGSSCSTFYELGTGVRLTASPALGWVFKGWSGGCTGTSPTCTVLMTAARSVVAKFGVDTTLLGEAVDRPELPWTTDGNANWVYQTSDWVSGGDAARSGALLDGQRSTIRTTVTGPGELRFFWRVSSEEGWDVLWFMFDGWKQIGITGEWGWNWRVYSIPAGTHTLSWSYEKDPECCIQGLDAGFLDLVEFIPGPSAARVPVASPSAATIERRSGPTGPSRQK